MIEIRDIKKGDIFYECSGGENIKMEALEDAREINNKLRQGYACFVRVGEKEIELYAHYIHNGYGPKLYKEPEYIGGSDEG